MTLLVNYKESALILEESPIQQKYKQGTEGNLYQVGCSSVCLYKRFGDAFEYAQVAVPLSLYIT